MQRKRHRRHRHLRGFSKERNLRRGRARYITIYAERDDLVAGKRLLERHHRLTLVGGQEAKAIVLAERTHELIEPLWLQPLGGRHDGIPHRAEPRDAYLKGPVVSGEQDDPAPLAERLLQNL